MSLRTNALEAGRRALDVGDWVEAAARFDEAVGQGSGAEALEGLGLAYFWLDDPRAIETRERAYHAYRNAGDRRGAARVAVALAYDQLTIRGEAAVGQGWLELASRQLDDEPLSAEHGLVAMWQADFAIGVTGDSEQAAEHAARAREIGRQLDDDDLELLGRAQQGNLLVGRGEVVEGMRLLTAAAAAAVNGEISDRALAGYACCYLINACGLVRDLDRAAQWCRHLDELCARVRFHALQETCRAEYAAVLVEQGDWHRAEEQMLRAARYLGTRRPPMAAEAWVRLADLRRRQGRADEARAMFAEAAGHPRATLGEGELALDAGDHATAMAAAERYLRAIRREDVVWRAGALDLLARARLAGGDLPGAEHALAELEAIVAKVGPGPLMAGSRLVRAALHLARSEDRPARHAAEDAIDLYDRAGARYGSARARLVLADVLRAGGDHEAAAREEAAGRRTLAALGATAEVPRPRQEPSPLTPREVDVLRLVADGLTNAEIAGHLVLSEHTVHRHVANVLAKLEVGSRAAAVGRASALGLL